MSNDLNIVVLSGRLGKDPEARYLANGDAVTNFSIAVGAQWKNKGSGEREERTDWIDIVAWRDTAEFVAQYLKKGAWVDVVGKLQVRKYKDKAGNDRSVTEVVAEKVSNRETKKQAESRQTHDPDRIPAAAQKAQDKALGGRGINDLDDTAEPF